MVSDADDARVARPRLLLRTGCVPDHGEALDVLVRQMVADGANGFDLLTDLNEARQQAGAEFEDNFLDLMDCFVGWTNTSNYLYSSEETRNIARRWETRPRQADREDGTLR